MRIGFLAEVEVSGDQVHLKDVAVYPLDLPRAEVGAAALFRALRADLMDELRQDGFRALRITGERLSGARPGAYRGRDTVPPGDPMTTSTASERAAALWNRGDDWEEILSLLRAEGFTKIDCIKATGSVLRLPLAQSKRIVHASRAWDDVRGADDKFHRVAASALSRVAHGGEPQSAK